MIHSTGSTERLSEGNAVRPTHLRAAIRHSIFRGVAMLNVEVQLDTLPHVIVVGNEKGGSGKTTIAMHIAVALLKAGQRLATIDLDGRQRTLTRYVENRRDWARRWHIELELPTHFVVTRADSLKVDENEIAELQDFERAIAAVGHRHDFVLIDTPPHDSYLMRLAHSIADTVVTPLNDSFVDLDVLAKLDAVTLGVVGVSHYGELVREMRRHRRSVDGALIDWVVLRNRLSPDQVSAKPVLSQSLNELALALGFRMTAGLPERPVYRDLFPRGLSAMDSDTPGVDADASHPLAQSEVQSVLEVLKLPIDGRGRRRAAARREWFEAQGKPLDIGDVLAEVP
jgi:chromosome partitioning protein